MKTTLIFDLDGTLLDTIDDLANSLNYVLAAHGYPTHSRAVMMQMVGNGLATLVTRALPGGRDDSQFDAIFAEFVARYAEHKAELTAPYPGIREMLSSLGAAGYRLAVVSNKMDAAVRELIPSYFGDLIPIAIGEREGVARKPAPDMVFEALRRLGATPGEAYFIGDSEVDVVTARNAGVDCLAVTWGLRSEQTLREAGATALFHTAAALSDFLLAGK